MNRARRKQIEAVKARLAEAKSELESIRDEEQEAFDNMPESIQGGERGEKSQEAIDGMEALIDAIDEFDGLEL